MNEIWLQVLALAEKPRGIDFIPSVRFWVQSFPMGSWIRSIKQKPGSKLFSVISDVTLPVGRGHSRSDPPCSRFLACAIALGSKPLALTRITRTGLETRLLKFEWEVRKPVYKILTENLETKTFFNPCMTLHFFRYLSRSVGNTDVCWIT